METVSIRNLRGKNLRENVVKGKPLAITNRGALIGVVVPVGTAWLEHLIDYNLSQVHQSIAEGEQAMAADEPIVTMQQVIQQLQAALNPRPASEDGPSVVTVRIGDLTAQLIERAGAAGQTLAITHDRELIGIVVPVTRDLVEFLLEENMSRVFYNIALAEKHIKDADTIASPRRLSNAPESPRTASRRGSRAPGESTHPD